MQGNQKRSGNVLTIIGLLLLAAAFSLAIYNVWDAHRANKEAQNVLEQLENLIGDGSRDFDPNHEMPSIVIDGNEYIGILEVPSLRLSLPVMKDWSYQKLKISPCRYSGSYNTDNLVVAGHNYARHFSPIKWIDIDSDVYFINVEGNVIHYTVTNVETLKPTQVKDMIKDDKDWDLTLFTCTTGGQTRCAVRCTRVNR